MAPSDIAQIYDRIDTFDKALNVKLDKVTAAITRIAALCEPCKQEIGRHNRVIFGNGQGGLIRDVTSLAAEQETQRKTLNDVTDTRRQMLSKVATFVANVFVAAIAAGLAVWLGT